MFQPYRIKSYRDYTVAPTTVDIPRKGMSERKKVMRKATSLRVNKEFKKVIRVLEKSKLNWLLEADSVETFPLNRGKLKTTFYWEGGEFPTGEEYAPSRSEYIISLKREIIKIQEIRSTTDKLWIFDKRGRLLFESPSEKRKIRRRPCRK